MSGPQVRLSGDAMAEKLLVVVDNRMLVLHMLLEYRLSFKAESEW